MPPTPYGGGWSRRLPAPQHLAARRRIVQYPQSRFPGVGIRIRLRSLAPSVPRIRNVPRWLRQRSAGACRPETTARPWQPGVRHSQSWVALRCRRSVERLLNIIGHGAPETRLLTGRKHGSGLEPPARRTAAETSVYEPPTTNAKFTRNRAPKVVS